MHALAESWPIIVSVAAATAFLVSRLTRLETRMDERMATKDDVHKIEVRLAHIEGRLGQPCDSIPSPAE